MSHITDLKELERKAYRSFFKDGIWDICFGILLLSLGVGGAISRAGIAWGYIIPDLHVITLSLYVVSMAVLVVGKKYITVPRLGAVKFGPARRARLSVSVLILAGSVLLGLVVFLVFARDSIPAGWLSARALGLLAFVVNCLVVFSLLAYFLDFSRLYGYAVLWAIAFPAADAVTKYGGMPRATSFLVTIVPLAGIMLATGLVLLLRFLRTYPPTPKEALR